MRWPAPAVVAKNWQCESAPVSPPKWPPWPGLVLVIKKLMAAGSNAPVLGTVGAAGDWGKGSKLTLGWAQAASHNKAAPRLE